MSGAPTKSEIHQMWIDVTRGRPIDRERVEALLSELDDVFEEFPAIESVWGLRVALLNANGEKDDLERELEGKTSRIDDLEDEIAYLEKRFEKRSGSRPNSPAPCIPSPNGRHCTTHNDLPLYPSGLCVTGAARAVFG